MTLPYFLASRFVAGEHLEDVHPVVDEVNDDGLHVALDKLGEHVHDREVAAAARDTYIDLIKTLAGRTDTQRNRISIKLSMMGQLIDEDFCLDIIRRWLEVAAEHDVFVRNTNTNADTATVQYEIVAPRSYRGYHGWKFANFSRASIDWKLTPKPSDSRSVARKATLGLMLIVSSSLSVA